MHSGHHYILNNCKRHSYPTSGFSLIKLLFSKFSKGCVKWHPRMLLHKPICISKLTILFLSLLTYIDPKFSQQR